MGPRVKFAIMTAATAGLTGAAAYLGRRIGAGESIRPAPVSPPPWNVQEAYGIPGMNAADQSRRFPALGRQQTVCTPPAKSRRVNVCVTYPDEPGPIVDGPDAVCGVLRRAEDADRESLYALLLNVKNQVMGVEEVAKGDVSGVSVHPRELFKSAITAGASGIVMAHNHPSGDPTLSREDIALTQRMADVGHTIGIPILDHVVVGRDGCVSAARKGLMGLGSGGRRGRGRRR